jgi:predicted ATPase/DNA-binding SARP family transcriptional activator
MLRIRTLGGLLITEDEKPVLELRSNKAKALLVFLAVEAREVSRGEMVGFLWPESSEKHAMTSLRVVVATLRQHVGAYLDISRSDVALKPDAAILFDGKDLETKVTNGDVEGALALYRGDFLTGFDIQDSAAFDEWRLLVQERYRRLLIAALQQASSAAIDREDFDNGLRLVDRLLDLDPLDETGHRYSMVLLTIAGQRSAALLHYEKLRKLLEDELGVAPSQETEELFLRIKQDEIRSSRKLKESRHNLPSPQTSFINRVKELEQIDSLFADPNCRLLTLVGPGGIGKTRLGIEAARRNLDHFLDGVYFTDLGSLSSPEHLITTIAEALNFTIDAEASDLDPKTQLLDFLENQSLLLVLDSFENLVSEASVIAEIIQRAPRIKVMVTSRERLGLRAEWVFKLEGLSVPEVPDEVIPIKENAIHLFFERATQVNHHIQTTNEELGHVAGICRSLEGIPLGIELAAAWSSTLSCWEIKEQIVRNLDFLSTKLHDTPTKHRSMRAVFDQSWELLTEEQRRQFRELSIFQGGFTIEAAACIVGVNLDLLSDLMDKSLLSRDVSGRFSMHNALQQYAAEKLEEAPNAVGVKDRHARYYVDYLLSLVDDLNGTDLVAARESLRKVIGNLRAAMDWSVIHWDQESARKAGDGFFVFYLVQGWHEGKDAFNLLAQLIAEKRARSGNTDILWDPIYLHARVHYAFLCTLLGYSDEAEHISNECLEPCHTMGLESERSICLHNLGVIAQQQGEYEHSRAYLEEAIRLGSEHPNIVFPTYYLWLGYVYFLLGDYSSGMACFQECYDLYDPKNTLWGKAFALSKMGLAADGLREYNLAMQYYQEALSIFERIEDFVGIAYTYSRLSVGEFFMGSFQQAIDYGQESYRMFRAINHRWGLGASLCRIGYAYLGLGEHQKAVACFDEALEITWGAKQLPLVLYALVGWACWMMVTGNQESAIALLNYVRKHPQTPALYLDTAEIWFEGVDTKTFLPEGGLVGENEELTPLEEVLGWVWREKARTSALGP